MIHLRRSTISWGAGIALTATALAPTTGAVAAEEPAGRATHADTSISGQLLRDGEAAQGWVEVKVWPTEEFLHALPEGTRFETFDLPPVVTDPSGRFEVAVPSTLPRTFVGRTGEVNLQIAGADGMTATLTNMTVVRADPRSRSASQPLPGRVLLDIGRRTARAERDEAIADARAAGRTSPGDVAGTRAVMDASALGMTTRPRPSSSVEPAADSWTCWTETGARHGPYAERFATFYGKAHAKGRVVHNQGTTHTVGIGVKPPGGTWGQSGTNVTKANGTSMGYDSGYTIVDAHVYNRIWQRYHYIKCRSLSGVVETTTQTKPDGFASGPEYSYAGHTDYTTCSPAYAGHTYHRTAKRNGAYAAGLNLPFVDLSAQSGWSTTTEMHWRFTQPGSLCGSGGAQWGEATRVSAK